MKYIQCYVPGTKLIDIGSNKGNTLDAILRCYELKGESTVLTVDVIDDAKHMVEKCKEKLSWCTYKHNINIRKGDICQNMKKIMLQLLYNIEYSFTTTTTRKYN